MGRSRSGSTSVMLLPTCTQFSSVLQLTTPEPYAQWGYASPSSLFGEMQGQALAHTAVPHGELWSAQRYDPGVALGLAPGDRSAAAAARTSHPRPALRGATDHQPLTHAMQYERGGSPDARLCVSMSFWYVKKLPGGCAASQPWAMWACKSQRRKTERRQFPAIISLLACVSSRMTSPTPSTIRRETESIPPTPASGYAAEALAQSPCRACVGNGGLETRTCEDTILLSLR